MNIKLINIILYDTGHGSGVYAQTPFRPDAPAHIPTHAPSGDVLQEQGSTPAEKSLPNLMPWKNPPSSRIEGLPLLILSMLVMRSDLFRRSD